MFKLLSKQTQNRSKFQVSAVQPSSRLKLTLQTTALMGVILLTSVFLPTSNSLEIQQPEGGGATLAIDSPTLSLDTLAMTEDGFLMKNSGQTAPVDRHKLDDIFEYTVESGDNLTLIAQRFGISPDTIIWENNVVNPHNLAVGTKLRILPISGITHVVSSKDNLEKIAKKHGISVERLRKQNQLKENTKIVAGTKLIIPDGKRTLSPSRTRLAANSPRYAAFTKTSLLDGTIIQANSAPNKNGRWMIKPTNGNYTSLFGSRPGHYAVDIANKGRTPILASAQGTVTKSQCGWNGGYGCMVIVDHGDNVQTLYAHLAKISVSVGQKVSQGQLLGKMGNTGRVWGRSGIHLHFEVIVSSIKKNPRLFYTE